MICYFVTARRQHTMAIYLRSWGQGLADRVRIVPYEAVVRHGSVPVARAYLFSDLERLGQAREAVASRLWQVIGQARPEAAKLNHPERTMRRYDLLQTLHDRGVNGFRACRIGESLEDLRYPVFLRMENDHRGNLSGLLPDEPALRRALQALRWRGYRQRDLLVTEFCDTADDARIYRKYAAFIVGGCIIPRHLIFGRKWMLKHPEISDDALAEEQRQYVESNPHEAELRAIARQVGIDYGRVDYALKEGRIQVWEINTNPTIMQEQGAYKPRNRATHELFAARIEAAFRGLAGEGGGQRDGEIALELPAGARGAVARERLTGYWLHRRSRLLRGMLPTSRALWPQLSAPDA